MNINVAENTGISHGRFLGTDISAGIGSSEILSMITKIRAKATSNPKSQTPNALSEIEKNLKAGPKKAEKAVAEFLAMLPNVKYGAKKGGNYNYNEGLSISEGTYLVMQNTEFSLELEKYQECLVVKWNPLYQNYTRDIYDDFDHIVTKAVKKLGQDDAELEAKIKKTITDTGFSSCNPTKGERFEDRLVVRENYYYFTQHFTEGDMLDPANIHNHPWLFAIRGVRDFKQFMDTIHSVEKEGQFVSMNEYFGNTDMVKDDFRYINKNLRSKAITKAYKIKSESEQYKWPIQQLVKSYNRLTPTYPGFYTQMDAVSYAQGTWPNTSPDAAKDLQKSGPTTKPPSTRKVQ